MFHFVARLGRQKKLHFQIQVRRLLFCALKKEAVDSLCSKTSSDLSLPTEVWLYLIMKSLIFWIFWPIPYPSTANLITYSEKSCALVSAFSWSFWKDKCRLIFFHVYYELYILHYQLRFLEFSNCHHFSLAAGSIAFHVLKKWKKPCLSCECWLKC